MQISRRQLAASILAAPHLADRAVVAAFVAAGTIDFAPNSYPQTTAGVARYVWTQRGGEFRPLGVIALGLLGLLEALSEMDAEEPVTQEILRAGPHNATIFHHGDGVRIIGVVLYGKPGVALPTPPKRGRSRPAFLSRSQTLRVGEQLDLFAMTGF
ncbi:hypothetical protein FV242_26795 [Methylobacterium sp. WL64]|uniref:hypothetical protein n=1 Tax=Methylobacterium sp. WL64 TaxID=2603894 RepID=UPI0011CA301F|nr:hypothetical protein [Methylobacterium sp. WL64]TXM99065.1 hypothetical protein FV242_26795 [Methylobacterium sp. WL64]